MFQRRPSPKYRNYSNIAPLRMCFGALIFLFLFGKLNSQSLNSIKKDLCARFKTGLRYNHRYPLTQPIDDNGKKTYLIGMIADLDKDSLDPENPNVWRSYMKFGRLSFNPDDSLVDVTFDDTEKEITTGYSYKRRGMELSELVTFNGHVLAFDDQTGTVFQVKDNNTTPWILLMDGRGDTGKGFKSEWATVKDDVMWVGSTGMEYITDKGVIKNYDPMYVKAVHMNGEVHHLNWIKKYQALRSAIGIEFPGYLKHESGVWSSIKKKWWFLPRRCSRERYNPRTDEKMGCRKMIWATENFEETGFVDLPENPPTFGYCSFKFVPGSDDNVMVVLISEEFGGITATYVTALTVDGETLFGPMKVKTDYKYEGIEFF